RSAATRSPPRGSARPAPRPASPFRTDRRRTAAARRRRSCPPRGATGGPPHRLRRPSRGWWRRVPRAGAASTTASARRRRRQARPRRIRGGGARRRHDARGPLRRDAARRLEPPRDDDLLVGVELDRLPAVGLEVAEEGSLGAAEREERHRRRDPDVDAEHAGLDPLAVLARPLAAAGEDAARVAEIVTAHDLDRLVEVLRPHQTQHRAEDLLAADRRLRLHVAEDRRAEEEAVGGLLLG